MRSRQLVVFFPLYFPHLSHPVVRHSSQGYILDRGSVEAGQHLCPGFQYPWFMLTPPPDRWLKAGQVHSAIRFDILFCHPSPAPRTRQPCWLSASFQARVDSLCRPISSWTNGAGRQEKFWQRSEIKTRGKGILERERSRQKGSERKKERRGARGLKGRRKRGCGEAPPTSLCLSLFHQAYLIYLLTPVTSRDAFPRAVHSLTHHPIR
ncbi:hypothetical protein V8C37DRAFT_142573 [Trichoderma ceciliae]